MSSTDSTHPVKYTVWPTDEGVLADLVPLPLAGRNAVLPPMFRYAAGSHPQLPAADSRQGTIYVYLVDSSPAGRADFQSLTSDMEVPGGMTDRPGGNPGLLGLVNLKEGDAVFARDIGSHGDPMEDALRVLITRNDQDELIVSKRAALYKSAETILGPRATRDARRIWFEEQPRAKDVGAATRCYGLSNMFERAKNSTAPPAALKVIDGQLDAVQLAVKELVRSGTDYNITMWARMAPQSLQVILESYAELVNTPRIGCDANYMWASCQLNVAEPQHVEQEQPLEDTNGRFGGKHIDGLDTPTHMTAGTVLSDLPEGCDPGRMHFLSIGCYTVLSRFKQFFFTGLLLHGSSRPLIAAGQPIPKWACRAMLVCYPNRAIMLGTVNRSFAAMPGRSDSPFYVTPHMYGGPHVNPDDGYHTTHATSAQDGSAVMDDTSLVNYHGRDLLNSNHWVMSLLPPHLDIEIDPAKFLSSITYRDSDGHRVGLKPWTLAPSPAVGKRYEDKHVEVQVATLNTVYNRMVKGIPELGPSSFTSDYLTDQGNKSRPIAHMPGNRRLTPLPPYDEYAPPPLPPRSEPAKKRRSPRRVKKSNPTISDSSDSASDTIRVHGSKKRRRQDSDDDDDDGDRDQRYNFRQSVRRGDECYDIPVPHTMSSSLIGSLDVGGNGDQLDGEQDLQVSPAPSSGVGEDEESQPPSARSSVSAPSIEAISSSIDIEATASTLGGKDPTHLASVEQGAVSPPTSETLVGVRNCAPLTGRKALTVRRESDQEREHRLGRLRDWCEQVNEDAFHALLDQVLYAVRCLPSTRLEMLCWSTSTLDGFQSIPQPFRMLPDDFSKYLSVFAITKQQRLSNGVWDGILHQKIMLHEHRLARSVMDIEDTLCPEIISRGTYLHNPQNWIEYLLRDIRIKIVIRHKSSIILSSCSYLNNLHSSDSLYTEPEWAVKERMWTGTRPTDSEFSRMAATCLARVLRCWFDLPNSYLTKGRAHLVDVLVAKFGPGVLYLEPVWELYCQLPRQLYRNPPWDYNNNHLNKERKYEPSSLDDFVGIVNSLPDKALGVSTVLAQSHLSFARFVRAYVQQIEHDNHDVTDVPNGPTTPCGTYDRRLNVIKLIQDTVAVLDHMNGRAFLTKVTKPQQALLDQPDSRICVREHAPSRSLMSANVDKSFMRSREGFFTALVFRNILFNSEAFLTCPPWIARYKFESLEDWSNYLGQLEAYFGDKPDAFFCNPLALGQPTPERTVHQAAHFYHVSMSCEWPDEWPVKFSDMHATLCNIKKKYKLPGCGPLGLYLLCADMVYYDMVEQPTLDDMATVVGNLGMGSLSGLELLGYLSPLANQGAVQPSYSFEQLKEALDCFYQDIKFLVSTNRSSDIDFTMVDVEHILCKFSRMWGLQFYRTPTPITQ